ncbi:hypothetical protein PCYB_008240 [Plasmodium cynomolgi strain B]|uniref:Uncharacterized protein n=1 Tax=Plasmodium cynomolgi (strain B) TaxID=1120755 RepID=K6V3W4_PLACD|nr:hypothetical protein PCYB_008240 [Plasmodium cynomolgi strain B]GAB70075.1 hypothetical protein PCYB_008240 [Plasmodium cynomolgi strain B]
MYFFGSLFSDDHGSNLGNGDSRQGIGGATLNVQGETWGKQILLYKEANRIDLLKKNEFDKSILVVANRGDSTANSHNDTAFTTNLEDAKIIQECTHQLLINEKAKVKSGESEGEAIIQIREIGLNYFGNLFEDATTSG